MARTVYVNGSYKPYAQAFVHVEDRGFQFADSVYEVIEVLAGRLIDADRHLERLERSLRELKMAMPASRAALEHIIGVTVARNRVRDGIVYVQVTRGEGPRDFAFPAQGVPPTLVVIARPQSQSRIDALAAQGIAVKTMPDIRWARCDIKTVMLLPACLAKDAAKAHGAREVWFTNPDGTITEGASSNAWIATRDGKLLTHPLSIRILGGVTRLGVIDAAKAEGIPVEEREFTLDEALSAREAFISSATNTVMPVVQIDGQAIGDGKPGPLTQRLRTVFHHIAEIRCR